MSKIINEKTIVLEIPQNQKKERLDIYLARHIENATRTKIQKLIKANLVTVNNKYEKSNYLISGGEKIVVKIPITPRPDKIEPEEIPLEIAYEDKWLMVINKPAGMVVHPSLGHHTGTLVNALLFYSDQLSEINTESRPGIVHRIDKDTSGLLLIAKDDWTHSELAKQFAEHTIEREYFAVCWGHLRPKKGEIIANIARSKKDRKIFSVSKSEGKYAHTFYEVVEEFDFTSFIKLHLKTGRTHQIRVHLSSIRHPIFGDPIYGGRRINYGGTTPKMKAFVNNLLEIMQRQALHAKTLGFFHPHLKKNLRFDSELPEDMKKLITKLKEVY